MLKIIVTPLPKEQRLRLETQKEESGVTIASNTYLIDRFNAQDLATKLLVGISKLDGADKKAAQGHEQG